MPSQQQVEERINNINSILAYFRKNGSASRRQLSSDLGLSWGCVSELSSILIEKSFLIETKEQASDEGMSKGRKPSTLLLNPEIYFLGVDINMRGLTACVANISGEKRSDKYAEIDISSKADFVKSVVDFVNSVLSENEGIIGIAFAMQGIYNKKTCLWEFSHKNNIYVDFSEDFKNCFNIPIFVEHDPNCILYGCIDGESDRNMILRLDGGVGCAILKNGEFLSDELLEVGYLVVNEQGDRLHSVLALNKIAASGSGEKLLQYLDHAGKCLGVALGNICNLFRLDTIYICGETVQKYDLLRDSFHEAYRQTSILSQSVKIVKVEVVDAAYGAAKIAIDRYKYYF